MSALTGKPLKGLHSLPPMLHVKGERCINNSSDHFRIIGKGQRQRSAFDKT